MSGQSNIRLTIWYDVLIRRLSVDGRRYTSQVIIKNSAKRKRKNRSTRNQMRDHHLVFYENSMDKFDFDWYDFSRSLLFCGPTWVGKTYKANEIVDRYTSKTIARQIMRTYKTSDGLFKQMVKSNMLALRPPKDRNNWYEKYPLEMMLRCWVLLYDDVWVSDISDAYIRDFTFVIDERIKKWLPTIFTTNLNKDELVKKLNERIVSRMMYNTDVVVFTGDDKRLATTKYYES